MSSDALQTANPASASPPPPVVRAARVHWFAWVLPFMPIALALGIAFALRGRFVAPLTPAHTGGGGAVGTTDLNGRVAPDFTLPNGNSKDGAAVTLSKQYAQGPVILLFYRSFSCHICVDNLHLYMDAMKDFPHAHFTVVAVSSDEVGGIRESLEMVGDVPVPLLADSDLAATKAYGLYTESDGYIMDGAFVIDGKGVVRKAYTGENPFYEPESLMQLAESLADVK